MNSPPPPYTEREIFPLILDRPSWEVPSNFWNRGLEMNRQDDWIPTPIVTPRPLRPNHSVCCPDKEPIIGMNPLKFYKILLKMERSFEYCQIMRNWEEKFNLGD